MGSRSPLLGNLAFETLLLPKSKQFKSIEELNQTEREDLALVLKKLTTRYDNLFKISFSYSMGFHFAPFNSKDNSHWQLRSLLPSFYVQQPFVSLW